MFPMFRQGMAREVSEWVSDGLIDRDQGDAILARYGTSLAQAGESTLGYRVLVALAVLFAGLALVLLVSANWEDLPRELRMGGLVLLTLGINLAGLRLLARGRDSAADLVLFAGALAYGASIMLIAQIYHLGEHFPDGILYWTLGVLPLAVLTRGLPLAWLCLGLASLWMVVEANTGFMPWAYPVFALAMLYLAAVGPVSNGLWLGSLGGLAAWTLLVHGWVLGDRERFVGDADWPALAAVLGLLAATGAAELQRLGGSRAHAYAGSLRRWLARGFVGLLLVASSALLWPELSDHLVEQTWPVAGVALAGLLALWRNWNRGRETRLALGAGVGWLVLALGMPLADRADSLVPVVLANLLLVAVGIGLIRRGIERDVGRWFHAGVGLLLLIALLRYFDLVGDYLGGAALFLVAAAVLFGAARYWRRRRRQGGSHAH